jgi:hypothetical protein
MVAVSSNKEAGRQRVLSAISSLLSGRAGRCHFSLHTVLWFMCLSLLD